MSNKKWLGMQRSRKIWSKMMRKSTEPDSKMTQMIESENNIKIL